MAFSRGNFIFTFTIVLLRVSPRHIYSRYRGFVREYNGHGMLVTTHLHLAPKLSSGALLQHPPLPPSKFFHGLDRNSFTLCRSKAAKAGMMVLGEGRKVKAYGGNRCIAPLILNFGTTWRRVVNYTVCPFKVLGKKPRHSQGWCGRSGE